MINIFCRCPDYPYKEPYTYNFHKGTTPETRSRVGSQLKTGISRPSKYDYQSKPDYHCSNILYEDII